MGRREGVVKVREGDGEGDVGLDKNTTTPLGYLFTRNSTNQVGLKGLGCLSHTPLPTQ